jgi:anti-sigma regulatory factor (Ser/Thr protein kinase)
MTGLADSASLAEADSEGWQRWLTTLDQVFPAGTTWPWANPRQHCDPRCLQVAVQEFDHETAPARTARLFTAGVLVSWAMPGLIDDAALAVCELVTNAVRHGLRTPITHVPVRLLMYRSGCSVLCMVTDPSVDPPVLREPDQAAESGRGLQVVAGVSRMWGWTPLRARGKAVWAGFAAEESIV